jgi:protein-L-isoaspartate O-methyltransferase
MPVGDGYGAQRLVRLVREAADRFRETDLGGVMFVPLVGAQGWHADSNGA